MTNSASITVNRSKSFYKRTHLAGLLVLLALPAATQSTPSSEISSEAEIPVFQDAVLPVLEKYCVSCHGPERARGQLRLDTLEGLRQGGKSVSLQGDKRDAGSLLLARILAPVEDEKRMPPPGKPRPSPDEIAVVQWWIEAGADGEKSARQLNPSAKIQSILAAKKTSHQASARSVEPKPRHEVLPLASQLADTLGISISPLSENESWLQANASLAGSAFGDSELAQLDALGPNLRWLNLAGTKITDQGIARVEKMKNLTRLHLERTALTDAGLVHLTTLSELEYLNLYSTKVTDAGLTPLRSLRNLRRLYLWKTQVTPEGAKAFNEALEDKAQIRQWEEEIAQLRAKINRQLVFVDTGLPLVSKTANAAPVNALCPVSGKPVDLAKTTQHEGRFIAFCCDDCKATFEKDPKAFLTKLIAKDDKTEPKE